MKETTIQNDPDRKSPNTSILDLIHAGAENAVSMRYLSEVLGTDQRTVRHMIEQERIAGNVIAGTDDGIFIPKTRDELQEYVHRTQSRINTSIATLEPAVRLLGDLCDE